MPGCTFRESYPQYSGLAACHTSSAHRRLIHVLKYASRVVQEGLPGGADFHSAWKTVEQSATDLALQVLNLAGKRWLRDAQALGRASIMLFLANRHEVAQMSQFHSDAL